MTVDIFESRICKMCSWIRQGDVRKRNFKGDSRVFVTEYLEEWGCHELRWSKWQGAHFVEGGGKKLGFGHF